eukprot:5307695-Prorocentrum_lima.AAC.1
MEELPLPSLRTPQTMEDGSTCGRVMLGEVRLRTEEEKPARASRDVSARFHPTRTPAASAVIANPAQKGKENATRS